MLLDSLPPGLVRRNHTVTSVHLKHDGTCRLIFGSGKYERFDLIFGADRDWPRLRPLVSTAQTIYSGALFFERGIDDVDARHPETA